MKSFKFKSLTMRIWTTFTFIILIIICSISLLYLFAYRKIDEKAKIADLKVAHNSLIQSNNYNQPPIRFDELSKLKGSEQFIYKVDDSNNPQIVNINRGKDVPPQGTKNNLPTGVKDGQHPPGDSMNSNIVKMWMAGFIKDENTSEKVFTEFYYGREYIFIISAIANDSLGKTYLISYMPNMQDNTLVYMMLGIGVTFIVIGFFTAKIVASRISKPLKQLENFTVRIAHKDWKEPIKVKSEDEIGRLAESMNRMQEELKHADEEEKMFLQSISHDLKTPVMVIMSHADAIIDGVYIDSVEKTAEIIRDEAVSLEKKIKQMLYLNTLDYVLEKNLESEEILLDGLVMHIINRFEVVNSKIDWELKLDRAVVHGNEEKLKVAIENILDNGLRYAEEKIKVSMKKENGFALLDIYNDGPNIPEKHVGRIFDNLYKDKTGNFGLGLAITKKIIDFYKGEIRAVNREKGVSFIIRLPLIK